VSNVSFFETTSQQLNQVPLVEGQIIFVTDSGEIYQDSAVARRIIANKGGGMTITHVNAAGQTFDFNQYTEAGIFVVQGATTTINSPPGFDGILDIGVSSFVLTVTRAAPEYPFGLKQNVWVWVLFGGQVNFSFDFERVGSINRAWDSWIDITYVRPLRYFSAPNGNGTLNYNSSWSWNPGTGPNMTETIVFDGVYSLRIDANRLGAITNLPTVGDVHGESIREAHVNGVNIHVYTIGATGYQNIMLRSANNTNPVTFRRTFQRNAHGNAIGISFQPWERIEESATEAFVTSAIQSAILDSWAGEY
jgi:hypothetical protein